MNKYQYPTKLWSLRVKLVTGREAYLTYRTKTENQARRHAMVRQDVDAVIAIREVREEASA